MDTDWHASAPYVKSFYVNSSRRSTMKRASADLVQPELDKALAAVRSGFGPVSLRENLPPAGNILLDLCALDATVCPEVTWLRNNIWHCMSPALWLAYIVHGLWAWGSLSSECMGWETPRANRTHLSALRARYGLYSTVGPSDGKCKQ